MRESVILEATFAVEIDPIALITWYILEIKVYYENMCNLS